MKAAYRNDREQYIGRSVKGLMFESEDQVMVNKYHGWDGYISGYNEYNDTYTVRFSCDVHFCYPAQLYIDWLLSDGNIEQIHRSMGNKPGDKAIFFPVVLPSPLIDEVRTHRPRPKLKTQPSAHKIRLLHYVPFGYGLPNHALKAFYSLATRPNLHESLKTDSIDND